MEMLVFPALGAYLRNTPIEAMQKPQTTSQVPCAAQAGSTLTLADSRPRDQRQRHYWTDFNGTAPCTGRAVRGAACASSSRVAVYIVRASVTYPFRSVIAQAARGLTNES
jgi:hypothetical protein